MNGEDSGQTEEMFYPDINKTKNSCEYPTGCIADVSEPRKLTPIPPLPSMFSLSVTSLYVIKLWRERGSPSECSDISAVVSSISNNIEILLLVLVANQ